MTDIILRNENGKIVGYDSNGNKVPISFEEGVFDSLSAEQLRNNPPSSTPFDWESMQTLREAGYVVTSDGQVYGPGGNAIQQALNDKQATNRRVIYAGAATYDPITLKAGTSNFDYYRTVKGMGGSGAVTVIDGGTTDHAVTLEAKQDNLLRPTLRDVQLTTSAGSGNPYDALHVVGDGYNVWEWEASSIEIQGSDRHGISLEGLNGGKVLTYELNNIFAEGVDETAIYGNQNVQQGYATFNEVGGAKDTDVPVIDYDGLQTVIMGGRAAKATGSSAGVRLGSNSQDVAVIIPRASGGVTDNAAFDANFVAVDDTFHAPGQFTRPTGTYGPFAFSNEGEILVGEGYDTIFDGGTSGHAIDITGKPNAYLSNVRAKTTAGGGNAYDAVHIDDSGAVTKGITVENVWIPESDNYALYVGDLVEDAVLKHIWWDDASVDSGVAAFIDGTNIEAYGLTANNGPNIKLGSNSQGCIINVGPDGAVQDNGTRNIVNGLGRNAGDPSSTGDWNGNGVEGVVVRDTTNANTYIYNAGSWSQIAST